VIAPHLAREAGFRKRFVAESRIAASLRHHNVLTVYDAGEQDGLLYLSMQLVEGSDLATMLKDEGPVSPGRAAEVLVPVAEALQAAHERGLVHRDVKPGNILIETTGGHEHVYLGDFGLARETTSATGLTSSGHWIGTADYVSPEQVMGEAVDARADVYSLGCVLFEMLCGRVPYPGRSETAKLVAHATKVPPALGELRPEISGDLNTVVHRAMARAPDQRFPSASSLREALLAAVEPKRAETPAPRRRRPAARQPAVEAGATAESAATKDRAEESASAPPAAVISEPAERRSAKTTAPRSLARNEPARSAGPRSRMRRSADPIGTAEDGLGGPATTVRSRRSAGLPGSTTALPWLRRHIAAGAWTAAILLVAGVAFAIGHSGTSNSGSAVAGREAKAGQVSLTVPASWRSASNPPSVPGLAFAGGLAVEEPGSGGVMLTGLLPEAGGDRLLTSAFLARLPRPPRLTDPVQIGSKAAYRYRNLTVSGLGRPLTLLVLPSTAAVVGVACLAPAKGAGSFMSLCEQAAGTLRLEGASVLPLGPDPAYGRVLAGVVGGLRRAQATGSALAAARTRAGQSSLTRHLAQSYVSAADRLIAAKPGPDAKSLNARLDAALRAAAAGYREMSRAAHAGKAGPYSAARSATTRALKTVREQLAALKTIGYGA
jgi:hypothetical protein